MRTSSEASLTEIDTNVGAICLCCSWSRKLSFLFSANVAALLTSPLILIDWTLSFFSSVGGDNDDIGDGGTHKSDCCSIHRARRVFRFSVGSNLLDATSDSTSSNVALSVAFVGVDERNPESTWVSSPNLDALILIGTEIASSRSTAGMSSSGSTISGTPSAYPSSESSVSEIGVGALEAGEVDGEGEENEFRISSVVNRTVLPSMANRVARCLDALTLTLELVFREPGLIKLT